MVNKNLIQNSNALLFLQLVNADCQINGIELKLVPVDNIIDPEILDYVGCFDSESKSLEVAINNPEWIAVLAHEYGHMQQWKEGLYEKAELFGLFWDVMTKTSKTSKTNLLKITRYIQACELDAEMRAAEFLKIYNLSADIDSYIQKANAYVLMYEMSRKMGKWPEQKGVYKSPDIYTLMPKKFIKKLGKISPKIQQAFAKYYT